MLSAEAFEKVVQDSTPETRDRLTEICDELMRATARILIELARVPDQNEL